MPLRRSSLAPSVAPSLLLPLIAGLVAGYFAAAEPARADGFADGRPLITARVFAPLPAGAALSVEPRDDSEANLRLRDLMVARLTAQHHPVTAEAPLRLRFSAEPLSSIGPRTGAATGEAVMARDHKRYADTNLDYSEADLIFGGLPGRPLGDTIQNRYQVRATLEARDGGRVLWTGQATGPLTERNEARLAGTLAEALADEVGRSFDSQSAAAPAEPAPSAATRLAPATTLPPAQSRASTALGGLRMPVLALPELAERR